jgi:uncharacterized protein with HEPN domain
MVAFARRARTYINGMAPEEFEASQMVQDAVTYRVGLIGEAARNVTAITVAAIDLDWRGIRGMRNKVFHDYGDTDFEILWKTVTTYLPPMIEAIERYLASDISSPNAS